MLLRNCRLIPELSGMCPLTLADVEVADGKIKQIAPADPARPMSGNEIDCGRHTLLPGLFDLHAHISLASARETPEDGMNRLVRAMGWIGNYTKHGVTTIRDCGSTLRLGIAMREAVAKGIVKGPKILTSGYILGPQSMYQLGRIMMMTMDIANTEDEFRFAARNQLALGADFIKIYASASASQSIGREPLPILRREEIRAMVEVAEMAGTYVAAHAHSLSSIKLCLEEGVRSIEHATFIDEPTIGQLETMQGVYLTPTLAVLAPPKGPVENQAEAENKLRMLDICSSKIGMAYQAGLKLGFGTDLYNGNLGAFSQEFHLRQERCGMKNIDILLQATKYSAEIAGLAGVTGELKPGLAADLILVEGNPDQDISVMDQRPLLVFQDGRQML